MLRNRTNTDDDDNIFVSEDVICEGASLLGMKGFDQLAMMTNTNANTNTNGNANTNTEDDDDIFVSEDVI